MRSDAEGRVPRSIKNRMHREGGKGEIKTDDEQNGESSKTGSRKDNRKIKGLTKVKKATLLRSFRTLETGRVLRRATELGKDASGKQQKKEEGGDQEGKRGERRTQHLSVYGS